MHKVFLSIYEVSLGSRLEAEPKYQDVIKEHRYFPIKLYSLARKMCNRSVYAVVEDILCNMLELIYSIIMIYRDEYKSLPKYLEVIDYYF